MDWFTQRKSASSFLVVYCPGDNLALGFILGIVSPIILNVFELERHDRIQSAFCWMDSRRNFACVAIFSGVNLSPFKLSVSARKPRRNSERNNFIGLWYV
jgi:hypothetical protein